MQSGGAHPAPLGCERRSVSSALERGRRPRRHASDAQWVRHAAHRKGDGGILPGEGPDFLRSGRTRLHAGSASIGAGRRLKSNLTVLATSVAVGDRNGGSHGARAGRHLLSSIGSLALGLACGLCLENDGLPALPVGDRDEGADQLIGLRHRQEPHEVAAHLTERRATSEGRGAFEETIAAMRREPRRPGSDDGAESFSHPPRTWPLRVAMYRASRPAGRASSPSLPAARAACVRGATPPSLGPVPWRRPDQLMSYALTPRR